MERSKQDNFGVILELGKGVPYHDGKMREAFKGFADRWKSFRVISFIFSLQFVYLFTYSFVKIVIKSLTVTSLFQLKN